MSGGYRKLSQYQNLVNPVQHQRTCEQRPGAIHLLRHYKFFPRHSPSSPVKFKLRHYYYSNTGCSQPLYTLNIHGTYRVDEKSWVVPEGTQMSYWFHKVSVVGYSEAVVGELQHIINESCSGHLYSTWTPHRQYTIFLSNLETDGLFSSKSDGEETTTPPVRNRQDGLFSSKPDGEQNRLRPLLYETDRVSTYEILSNLETDGLFSSKSDGEQTTAPPVRNRQDLCLENVYRMFQDLDLLKIVHRPSNALDPYDRTKLYLGDLNVDIEQRKSHLPTAFQVPLIKSSTLKHPTHFLERDLQDETDPDDPMPQEQEASTSRTPTPTVSTSTATLSTDSTITRPSGETGITSIRSLENDEWEILQDCLILLTPFDKMTCQLSGEQYPTLSTVIPLVIGLRTVLSNKICVTPEGDALKAKLVQVVNRRLSVYEWRRTGSKSTFLDPRFKLKGFGSEENADYAKKLVIEELSTILIPPEEEESTREQGLQGVVVSDPQPPQNVDDDLWAVLDSKIQGCDVCKAVLRSSDKSPPILSKVENLPLYLDGEWISGECETQPLGMFVKRSLYVTLNNFTYETNLYAESTCTSLTMSITYRGDFHVTKLDLAGRTTPRKEGSSVTYEQRKHFVGTLDKLDEKKTQGAPQFSVVPLVEMFANTRELLSQNALMREARLRHGPLKDNLYETVHINGHGTYETNRYSNEQFDRTFPGKSESLSEESVHQKGTFKGVDTLEDGNEPSEDQDNESVRHPKDSFEAAAIEDKNGAAKKERLDAIEDPNEQKEGVIKTLRLQDTNDLEDQLYETGQGTNRRLKRIDTFDETRPIMDTSDEDYYKVLAELEAEGWPELGSNQRKRADFEDNLPTNDIDETTGEKSDEIVSRSDAKGDEETPTAFEDTANKKDQTVSRVSNIDELLQTTDVNQNREDLIDLYDKTLDKTTGQLPKELIDELLSRQTLRHKRHIKHGNRQHKHGHHEKLHRPKMENEPMYKKTGKEPFEKKNQMQNHDKTLLKEPFDTENNPKQHHDETLKKKLAKKEEQPMAPEETLPKGPSDKEDETNSDKVLSAILPVVLDQTGVLLPHVKVNQMNPIDRKDLEYFVRQIGNGEHFRLPHHGHIAKEFDSDVKNAREGGNRLDKLDNNARNSKDNPTPHPKSKTDVTKHHTNQDQIQPTEQLTKVPKHTHHSKRKHNHRQQEPTPNMPERILYWYNKPNIGRVPVVEKIGTMGLLNNPTKDTPKEPTEEELDIQVDFSNNPGDANVQNDGNIVRNEGKLVKGDGNIVQNEGETEQNDGNIVQNDENTVQNDENTVQNDRNTVQNDGNVVQADGNIDQVEDNEYLVEFHIEAADLRLYDYDLIENLKYDQKCAARFQLWGTIIGDTIPLHSSCESIGIQLPHTEHTVAKLRLNRDQYALYLDQPEDNSATAHRIVNYHSLPLHKCKLFADDSYRNFGLRGILGVGFLKGVILDQGTSVNDFEEFQLKEIDYEDEDEEGIDEPPDQIEMDYVVAQSGENGTDYESGVGQSGANALCVIAGVIVWILL
ncbi:hypothetical protein M8J77_009013 [Diaphorina citri]|nr:hypothetical protein M8J77_009013 [Diaphorina citri]